MLMHALMAALSVFICFAGNYLTGQSMMERPLVVGLVTGILMGDMKTGILMGAALEAVFLGNVNIGGVIAAEPVTATTLATTFAIISHVETRRWVDFLRISEEIIEKVKEQNDIVDVVSDVVRLKRAGRNFSGLCPFHNEKSPSFSVSPDKQIFKCFGCGEAGNVISFVMKTKNLNFVDAVKELADRANIIIPIEDGKQSESQKKKQVLYNINKQAARYYFSNLQNNKEAKEYFLRRGIKENILKSFGLGYAKEGWQNTINHLRKQGFSNEAIEAAGLGIKSSYIIRY